ncbi:hypothetical protein [Mycobacteroides abscessus]|uniref:hypothetical protein n=1 Tax=Mycobacteroides abscessus TaxID=36809 RepID=UPI0009416807|nr:hypothetical protein [Mycobacteroides abscessus]
MERRIPPPRRTRAIAGLSSENARAARQFVVQVRSACEDLIGNPYDVSARQALLDQLTLHAANADEFMRRAIAESEPTA